MKDWNWTKNEQGNPMLNLTQGQPGASLIPTSYLEPVNRFYQDIDRMFDNAFRSFGLPSAFKGLNPLQGMMVTPSVDISSTDKEYTIEIEMPGISEDDVRLDVSRDGQLCICGEKRQENDHQDKNFHRVERSYGSFSRTLSLPEDLDQDNIEARFNNGILTITAPRTESSAAQGRRIPINAGEGGRQGRQQQNRQQESGGSASNANAKRAA